MDEGQVVIFYRQNAYIQLIAYGPPGYFTPDRALSMAKVIDERLGKLKFLTRMRKAIGL